MLNLIERADTSVLRHDFPIFSERNRGKPLIYLDSAASAQKPQCVIEAMNHFYCKEYANIHRGVYELSELATKRYEAARERVRAFVNAPQSSEIIFTSGTTEGINLVAAALSGHYFKEGDEIILSQMEHHSNIVPWYLLKEHIGVQLKVIPITDAGEMDIEAYQRLFTSRTKMVALVHVSNVLGTINPVKLMTDIAHQHNVPMLLDGAQAITHMPVDLKEIECDFYVFSSHKLYGPTGIGVLYVKNEWLSKMTPYQGGGDMIESVSFSGVTYAKPPQKFEAGTPNIAGVIGLDAAIRYLEMIGMEQIKKIDNALLSDSEERLSSFPGLRIIGRAKSKAGIISFVMDKIHPHDISTVLDHEGIAVRAGHHCAMPLMAHYQVPATVRISFGIYNNKADIDALISALELVTRLFK